MYLHCHTKNCGWSQDDFWNPSYNPVNFDQGKDLYDDLFKDRIYFGKECLMDMGIKYYVDEENKTYCKGADYVSHELERRAKKIKNMLVKTYDEFKEKQDTLVCPRCGQQNWDID
jgi:hypothetical protein